jgi:hypothetical protein
VYGTQGASGGTIVPTEKTSDSTEGDPSQNKYPRHLTLAPHSTPSLAETSPTASTGPSASRNSDVQPSARIGHNPNTPPAAPGELHPDVAAPSAPQSSRRLTQQQGLLRVYSKSQTHDDSTLSAWTVETDLWGGRLGGTIPSPRCGNPVPASFSTQSSILPDLDSQIEAWASAEPFTAPPPARMTSALREVLDFANQEYCNACGGNACGGILDGWESMQAGPSLTSPSSSHSSPGPGTISWTAEPQNTWYERPLGSRNCVGHELLVIAQD